MKSLQVGGSIPDVDYRAIKPGDPHNANPQHIISVLKHRTVVQKALDLIQSRIQDPPTLGELALCSGLSRTYFSCVFKGVMGMRLQDYLIQARLNKAKDLLVNIDLKIKKIAYESGFRDPNYFCQFFKKRMGLNPTNWRLKVIRADKNFHIGATVRPNSDMRQ